MRHRTLLTPPLAALKLDKSHFCVGVDSISNLALVDTMRCSKSSPFFGVQEAVSSHDPTAWPDLGYTSATRCNCAPYSFLVGCLLKNTEVTGI